jgi:hypothetical protein
MTRIAMVLLWLLLLAACGGSPATPQGPTAAGVAVQPADVPHGLVRCDASGDIQTFINRVQASDPGTAKNASTEWEQSKKSGATAAYVAIYADSQKGCTDVENGLAPSAATFGLIVNFVLQFKDEKSAADAYTTNSIFGTGPSGINGSQATVGTKTGLSAKSIVVSQTVANQTFFVAIWQNKTFAVYLGAENLGPTAGQRIALAENSRVK